MKIYNQDKTQELNMDELDFSLGHLEKDKLLIAHHDAVEAREAVYVDRIVPEESGFNSIYKDLVFPAVKAREAYDEYEDIQVYVPYTESELQERAERKELTGLENWFTEVYDTQVKQYNRCQRLGIEYDNKYGTISELDEQATINAKRISELRKKYSIM